MCNSYAKIAPLLGMLIFFQRLGAMLATVYKANNRVLYNFLTHLGQEAQYGVSVKRVGWKLAQWKSSAGSFAEQHHFNGIERDHEVQEQALVFHVVEIKLQFLACVL